MDFQLCCLFALLVIGFRNVVSECHVDGQQYAADSRFILELYTCIRHHCKCFQDATWSCPASESERICDATSPPKTTIARNVPVPFGRGYLGPGFTLPPSRIPGNLLPQNFFPGRYVFPGHVRYGNVPGYNNPRNTGSGWWAQMAGHSSRSDYERKNVLYKAVQSRGYYHESGTGEQSGPVIVRQDSGPIIIHDKNDRGGVRNSRPGYPARKEHVLILPLEPVTEKPPGERTGYQTGADRRSGQNPGGRRQHAIRAGAQQPRQPSGQQPRQSGGQQPRQPSGQQPRQPSGQQPRQSGGQQPHQSGGQQPRQPGGQQPRQPVYRTDRRQSGGQQPRQPSGQQPRQSGGQQPRQPSGQQPRQPSGQQPRQPGGQQPRQSGGQQPRQPGGQQPRQPVYRTDRQQQSWDQQRRSERQRSGHATRPGDQRSRDGQNSGQSRHDSSRPIHAGRQGRTDYQPRRPNTQRRPDRTDPRVSRPDVNHQNRMSRPGVSPGNLPGERPAHRGSYPRSRGRHPTFMSGGPKQHITSETMHPNPSNANARKTVPRSCLVDGQNYALNSRFSLSRGCTRLVCYCRTDGTSSCPEDEMQDLCSDRDRNTGDGNQSGNQGSQDTKGATYCEADGLRYPVHANFTLRRDCNLLLCRCNSDGGYSCLVEPGQCADDVSDSSRSVEGSRPGRLGDRGELTVRAREPGQDSSPVKYYCYASGRYFKVNTWFAYQERCIQYHCFCQADGRHSCPEDRRERACEESKPTPATTTPVPRTVSTSTTLRSRPHRPRQSEVEDRVCVVQGHRYRIGSRFQIRDGCRILQCFCSSNAVHECPPKLVVDRCPKSTSPTIAPTTTTSLPSTRHRAQPGRITPPTDRRRGRGPPVDDRRRGLESYQPQPGEVEERVCVVQGHRYRIGSRFQIRDGCRILQCFCSSNAVHECPPKLVVDRCPKSTSTTIAPTTTTSLPSTRHRAQPGRITPPTDRRRGRGPPVDDRRRGLESYQSQPGRLGLNEDSTPDLSVGSAGAEGRPMIVGQHPVNTTVKPGKQARLYCRIRTQGHPRMHWLKRLNDDAGAAWGRRIVHVEDERFQVILADNAEVSQDDSSVYDSYLTLEKVTYTDSGMYMCMASNSRGYSYRAAYVTVGTRPENRVQSDDSHATQIKAALPSSSIAQSTNRATRALSETTEGVVKYCRVGGRQFIVNAGFTYEQACTRYHCACYSNATWACPETENICDRKTSRPAALTTNKQDISTTITSPTSTVRQTDTKDTSSPDCKSCILDGTVHRSNSMFNIHDGCMLFICDCLCDGTWVCPKDRTKNSCQTEAAVTQSTTERKTEARTEVKTEARTEVKTTNNAAGDVTAKCHTCRFRSAIYPGGEPFVFDEDCLRYQCVCNCDGTWECSDNNVNDICEEESTVVEEDDETWSGCRTCTAHGNTYKAYAQFEHERDCVKMTCHCLCDGTVYCPPNEEERVC